VRTASKAAETAQRLTEYTEGLATGRIHAKLVPRGPSSAAWSTPDNSAEARKLWSQRLSIEPIQLDLCALPSVYDAAKGLAAKYPRIDSIICNAGIGGWSGLSWFGLIKQAITEGPMHAVSEPKYKICRVGAVADRQLIRVTDAGGKDVTDDEPKLAEVFCANLFGHYVLVHEILSLLERSPGTERARVIWVSTVEAYKQYFKPDDFQGFKSSNAYESSKRLTDLLVLSAATPGGNQWVKQYLGDQTSTQGMRRSTRVAAAKNATVPPNMYLSHPGICATAILPIATVLVWGQMIAFFLCRVFGSYWHTTVKSAAVTAPVWLALEEDHVLEEDKIAEKKWGSAAGRWGEENVRETHVEELGSSTFADLGARCWEEMEDLRVEWDGRVKEWQADQ
jgi:3-keto steroid reductase